MAFNWNSQGHVSQPHTHSDMCGPLGGTCNGNLRRPPPPFFFLLKSRLPKRIAFHYHLFHPPEKKNCFLKNCFKCSNVSHMVDDDRFSAGPPQKCLVPPLFRGGKKESQPTRLCLSFCAKYPDSKVKSPSGSSWGSPKQRHNGSHSTLAQLFHFYKI